MTIEARAAEMSVTIQMVQEQLVNDRDTLTTSLLDNGRHLQVNLTHFCIYYKIYNENGL